MNDYDVVAISMATLGQIALALSVLLSKIRTSWAFLPLALLLTCVAILLVEPLTIAYAPSLRTTVVALMLPALLCLGPLLWMYVTALTSQVKWSPKMVKASHFIMPLLGLLAALLTIALPVETKRALLETGEMVESKYVGLLMIFVFVLIIGWVLQSGFYLLKIIFCLKNYRYQLQSLFSNNDKRELNWITHFTLSISLIWIIMISGLLADNLFDYILINKIFGTSIALVLVWILSFFGINQTPGFAGRYLKNIKETEESESPNKKYQRSALGQEQSQRIESKIAHAMQSEKLYLDPNMSLASLSKHLNVPTHYVSQTLNETIGSSFFDYINHWRVEEAKRHLAESDMSILDITNEVGFNARSSFYKAFKLNTGMTPTEFKKHAKA